MKRLDNISDLDITTGDKSIQYLAQEFGQELSKKYNVTTRFHDDGHGSIYIGSFKMDFSSNFNVPTSPLTVDGSQLLLLATNQSGLIYDSSETQTVNQNNVTWSELNPFGTMVNLFSADGLNSYVDCDTCTSTMLYKATTLVRSLTNTPYVQRMLLTKNDIDNINNNGPIFTFIMAPNMEQSPLAYELLNYYL
jgi:hypothetical protein